MIYRYFQHTIKKGNIKNRLLLLPLILAVLFLGMRSSVGVSTPNIGFYTFSQNELNNEIANNSLFSVLYSLYMMENEKFYNYGNISYKDAINNVKKMNHIQNNSQTLTRYQHSLFSKQKNIILVILESFGHESIGYLGGTPTTPNLDKLIHNALYFTNLYAVGYRTSWGISSVVSSLYPIPSCEYIKASKSQNNFYTIAKTLDKKGYDTTFLYGGDVDFDNMRGFLSNNGFKNVYGEEVFHHTKTKYTWGYCDEDLYEKAFEIIQSKKNKPYFLTLMTLSSHEPFDYPKNKTPIYPKAPAKSFANSVKYADYAIGKFMQKLKKHHMLQNTVVAFVADHCSKVRGKMGVPVDKYKIAAMIVSDDFKGGKKYDKIASQIDIAPTLLDVAGISATIPTMGSSVLQNQRDSALLIAKKKNFAYLKEKKYVIFEPNQNYQTYNYQNQKIAQDKTMIQEGLSYIYASHYLYKNRLYH
ncbi:Phosphoglycerol transferase I [hydrothermal vent metagenome]|uniref:Phosphoglycerol transferase I n=1 Tax=hydrothermal vent metagenome TaxID=652676 RepID=A0A1W1D3S2_9ZZZZ